MGHETEAVCLLRTGNLYPRRVGLRAADGRLVFAGIKHSAISLYDDDDPHAHFDLDGRWQRAYRNGIHYRKALDGSVDAIARQREGANLVLRRRSLPFTEIVDLDAAIRDDALALLDELGSDSRQPLPPPPGHEVLAPEELRELLERIVEWDTAAWFRHRERYLATYRNLPFLPPDAHQSAVLQTAVEGVWRTPDEMADHARSVVSLLGRRLAQCRRIFLAGNDFLRRPLAEATAILDTVADVLPLGPTVLGPRKPSERPVDEIALKGIDVMLDDLAPPLPDRDGWAALRERGLGRVTLLVESLRPDVRARFGRTWTNADLQSRMSERVDAEIPLSLVLLVGAEGYDSARATLADDADALAALPWRRGDIVYLVDVHDVHENLDDVPDPSAREAGRTLIAPRLTDRGVKVLPYSRDKEWN
jgi:hypothetical protein